MHTTVRYFYKDARNKKERQQAFDEAEESIHERLRYGEFDYYEDYATETFRGLEPLGSLEEAKAYYDKKCAEDERGEDRSYVIPYRAKITARVKDLEVKIPELEEKIEEYILSNKLSKRKSKSVSCLYGCGAVLPTKYADKNKALSEGLCPVCGSNLMSDTYNDTLKGYRAKLAGYEKELREELKKTPTRGIEEIREYIVVAYDAHS